MKAVSAMAHPCAKAASAKGYHIGPDNDFMVVRCQKLGDAARIRFVIEVVGRRTAKLGWHRSWTGAEVEAAMRATTAEESGFPGYGADG